MGAGKTILIAISITLGCWSSGEAASVWVISGTASGTMGDAEFTDAEIVITARSSLPGEPLPDHLESDGVKWSLDSPPSIDILGLGTANWEGSDAFTLTIAHIGIWNSDSLSITQEAPEGLRQISLWRSTDVPLPLSSEPFPIATSAEGIPTDRGDLFFNGGTVYATAIPEPSVAMLGAVALLGMAGVRRRIARR